MPRQAARADWLLSDERRRPCERPTTLAADDEQERRSRLLLLDRKRHCGAAPETGASLLPRTRAIAGYWAGDVHGRTCEVATRLVIFDHLLTGVAANPRQTVCVASTADGDAADRHEAG